MKFLNVIGAALLCVFAITPHSKASSKVKYPETQCDLDSDPTKKNASRLCVQVTIGDGRLAIDRNRSVFNPSTIFLQHLKISRSEAEIALFGELQKLLDAIPRPYRLALSATETSLDDKGQLNDPQTNDIRTANKSWTEYLQLFDQWVTATGKERGVGDIFPEAEATGNGGLLFPFATSQERTALLIYEDGGYDAEAGIVRFSVADPIDNWRDPEQVQIRLPGVSDNKKREERLERIYKVLEPLSGQPRCLGCLTLRIENFYKGLGLTPNLVVDNKGTSPLIVNVIEGARIVGVSWLSLDDSDPNVDKVLYSLLTDSAFRAYIKRRTEIAKQKQFDYLQDTGTAGPYLNPSRLQIQQLLVNQLGYSISFSFAPNRDEPLASSFNLTIQKNGVEEQTASEKQVPESAPATSNDEGIVTAHEQEKDPATEFDGSTKEITKPKDKKRYIGGGVEYQPGQGARFFGLAQVSRFPLLPDSVNNFSIKFGGQGTAGAIGSVNYFADYLFFNSLHRRVSVQLTVASDLDPNRDLGTTPVDERQSLGFGRIELEPFRDWSGSMLRFYVEGRHETVALHSEVSPTAKTNLTTLEFGSYYFFESTEVEKPTRLRLQPLFQMGLGLATNEPRYNKVVVTGNYHHILGRRFELDFNGRLEQASTQTPRFELPSFGGAEVVRGFRRDDGLGRSLWSVQNEVWIPLPIHDESNQGLRTMLREKVKVAPFFDAGGLYQTVTSQPGFRSGTGVGVRFIYSPIIFKVDYGYGFGPRATGGSPGKFYFSIGSNLPF